MRGDGGGRRKEVGRSELNRDVNDFTGGKDGAAIGGMSSVSYENIVLTLRRRGKRTSGYTMSLLSAFRRTYFANTCALGRRFPRRPLRLVWRFLASIIFVCQDPFSSKNFSRSAYK